MFGANGQSVGVGIPQGQRGAQEPTGAVPGTVLNFAKAETFGVQYVDAQGRTVTTMVHRIAGVWYLAPNGENYSSQLRPLGAESKLRKTLEERFVSDTTTSTIPKEDSVDIKAGT